ncbi:MAG TPA: hypothetical protein VK919_11850, partial [Solirubrobacterales bacterium]|nr:hypothetical protein [Solirubrobacterales bacterium]
GTCAAGVKFGPPTPTGENAGAPDLMMTKPAPCGSEDCSAETLFDYANDLEPAEPDIGLQKVVPVNSFNGGCLTNITDASSLLTLGPDPQWYVHKWVSKPIPADSDEVVLSGSGALYLWTQTVNGGTYPGRICVWLFKRGLTGGGAPIDTLTVNTTSADSCDPDRAIGANQPYHQCSKTPSWHSGSWGELTVPLTFAGLTVEPDERIGLAIAVEREGTGGGGLQFMYDAPTYDTRLELNTKSALPF